MKALSMVCCAALLLLLAFCSSTSSAPAPNSPYCCLQYNTKPLPLSHIKEYHEINSSGCDLPSVVFTTKRGKRVCGDPMAKWVQDRVQQLKNRN